ncbi:response regulator transcription factor [Burkholderia sp. JSH-S8]|nr:response regulator transcription factor [Burkholderia sp. JSH-S8]
MKINLVLADDHPALLAGIQHELAGIPTLNLIGTARNSTGLVDLLSRERCDILVTDYAMPGGEYGDGMQLLSFLRRRYPAVKIIVFTAMNNPALAQEMGRCGVSSVLNKVDEVGHLISAIHAVNMGATYFPAGSTSRTAAPSPDDTKPSRASSALTKREAEVLRLYIAGKTINEIADQLHRTKQTISAQKMNGMRKLGVDRDALLFRYAHEIGLVAACHKQC